MRKKVNYLDNIPVINGDIVWEKEDGIVTVLQKHKGIYSKIAQKFFHTPKVSMVDLDEFGSFVWCQINGERTIYDIGQIVLAEFGKDAEPLYDRLSKYFYTLKDVDFISFKKRGRS